MICLRKHTTDLTTRLPVSIIDIIQTYVCFFVTGDLFYRFAYTTALYPMPRTIDGSYCAICGDAIADALESHWLSNQTSDHWFICSACHNQQLAPLLAHFGSLITTVDRAPTASDFMTHKKRRNLNPRRRRSYMAWRAAMLIRIPRLPTTCTS